MRHPWWCLFFFIFFSEKKFSTSPVDKPVDKMLKTNWCLFPLNHLQFLILSAYPYLELLRIKSLSIKQIIIIQ